MLDKLQKEVCRIVGPTLADSLKTLTCRSLTSLSLFNKWVKVFKNGPSKRQPLGSALGRPYPCKFLEAVFQNFYLVCSRILFPKYYLCRWSSELSQLVLLPQLRGRSPVILIGCLIFLSASPFLDVTRMSLSTVSFLARLNSGIICLQNAVRRFTYDLNGFTSRVNGHLLSFYLCFRSN